MIKTATYPSKEIVERELKKYYRIRRSMKDSDQYNLMIQIWKIDEWIDKYEKICGKTEEDFIIEEL